jgi:hypothetical protein
MINEMIDVESTVERGDWGHPPHSTVDFQGTNFYSFAY